MRQRFATLLASLAFGAMAAPVLAQAPSSASVAQNPSEPWITHPAAQEADERRAPIALQFRRELTLPKVPRSLPVRVSADNRFVLYVNGVRAAAGPARGDLAHWRYEAIDIAPLLKPGRNVLAAQVWNDGANAPAAQLSAGRTGFLLKAEQASFKEFDTGPLWEVRVDASRSSSPGMKQLWEAVGPTYYVGGAPEELTGAGQLMGWMTEASAAGEWASAVTAPVGAGRRLVADTLPQMRYERVPSGRVVRAQRVQADAFPEQPITIPANSKVTILLDAGRLLAAYPVLTTSGGQGATVKLVYAESLYDQAKLKKVALQGQERLFDRSSIEGGVALGLSDIIRPDGREGRFAPFWWRAWRFLQIEVETAAQPLTLTGFETWETGYPFRQRGHFISSDPELNEIWRIGWMTALLDAHETYMDTAYWEQLQYIGDTRIQALISYAVAGDDRLAVQALDAFDASRVVDGLPQASWPQQGKNSIPPFALLWIGTLHDYWMRHPDDAVIRRNLVGLRSVLDWYAPHLRPEGTLRATPGWLFVDWKPGLDGGTDRDGKAEDSCPISLLYVGALKEAAELERAVGDPARASANEQVAARVAAGVQTRCWDAAKGLYADTPNKKAFSQHVNLLAVLHDVAPADQRQSILERVTTQQGIAAPEGITSTSYYFSFYLGRALAHAGMGNRYQAMLRPWRDMLKQNFSTWPENPPPSRSDSHAWSAHPTTGLLSYVAGIQPAAPGFRRVRIAPQLGALTSLDAAMAHPAGLVRTRYTVSDATTTVQIDLPKGVTGSFELGGRSWPLRPGANRIEAPLGATR